MRQTTRWRIILSLWLPTTFALATEHAPPPPALVVQKCAGCHGLDGQSRSDAFPKLAQQNPDYLIKQLFNFKTGQRVSTVMLEMTNALGSDDIRTLAAYYAAQPVRATPAADRTLAQAGKRLYFSGNPRTGVAACASCHGPTARGGAQLPRLASQHASYLAAQLVNFRNGTRGGPASVMHGVVSRISDREIRAVAQYLSGLS